MDFHQYCSFKIADVTFFLVYRSPSAPSETLVRLAELIRGAPKNSMLIGDFNLPEVNWEAPVPGGRARPVLEAMEEQLMSQQVLFPTQVSGNILDLVITNIPERIVDIYPGDRLGGSDHTAIHLSISMEIQRPEPKTVFNWFKANFTGMRAELSTVLWQDLFRSLSPEEKWAALRDRLQAAVNSHVPVKQVGPPGRPPWMTREIQAALKRKRRLWRSARETGCAAEYKEADKEVKKMIRRSKRNFEKKLASGDRNNKRPFYAYVKKKTKSRATIGPLLNKDKIKVTTDKDMADVLNRFFCSVFTKDQGRQHPVTLAAPVMSDFEVTAEMVKRKIDRLRPDSAAGPDGIGPKLLQELKEELAPVLAEVFNDSLRSGVVPSDWREANVTPIFKKGQKSDPGNYRPVSLTSVCCKLLEGLIKDKLMEHFQQHDLILSSQHGFMPGRSCTTNLLEFFEVVTAAVDEGKPVDVVFLDFAKAFDKVPKGPLLAKLQQMGVGGQTLNWIKNWLSDRKQRVVINGQASDWGDVDSGFPQGSILGPVLFVVHINDIDLAVKLLEIIRKFADDTKLGQIVATQEQRDGLQAALSSLMDWATDWGMEFNVKKCKVMHIGHNNQKQAYHMGGEVLQVTEEEKDVGVTVSKNLKPSAQCARAARTATLILGQISRAFHFRDRNVFLRLYKQYVLPHLEFASPAWSPWTMADKEVLERVQEKAIRMVSGLDSRSYEARLKELGMLSLEERRHQTDMVQLYKIIHGYDSVDASHWFQHVNSNGIVTRGVADPLNLVQARSRLDIRKNFYSQRVAEAWNRIPYDLKRAPTIGAFKFGYKKFRTDNLLLS